MKSKKVINLFLIILVTIFISKATDITKDNIVIKHFNIFTDYLYEDFVHKESSKCFIVKIITYDSAEMNFEFSMRYIFNKSDYEYVSPKGFLLLTKPYKELLLFKGEISESLSNELNIQKIDNNDTSFIKSYLVNDDRRFSGVTYEPIFYVVKIEGGKIVKNDFTFIVEEKYKMVDYKLDNRIKKMLESK